MVRNNKKRAEAQAGRANILPTVVATLATTVLAGCASVGGMFDDEEPLSYNGPFVVDRFTAQSTDAELTGDQNYTTSVPQLGSATAGGDIAIRDDNPGVYTVVRGDTLWDISARFLTCLLYTSPSPRDATLSRMPSSA